MTSSTTQTAPIVRGREIPDAEHPDTRPCPAWCWISANNPDGYSHEIIHDDIETAVHTSEEPIDTRASLYPADQDTAARTTRFATLESSLEQRGADNPQV